MGFFQKVGLNAEVRTLNNGAAVSAAVAGGALDVGVGTPVLVANAVTHGIPFVMVAAGSLDTPKAPTALLCVLKNSPIRGPKDLEGKTVAVPGIRALADVAIDVWLGKNGVEPAKVLRVEVVMSAMGASVERGTVAAAMISEPALSNALKGGNMRSLGDPLMAIGQQILIGCWYTTTTFAEKNPDAIRRFQNAIGEAGRWANDHHDDSAVILAKYTQMDLAVIRAMQRCPYADQLRVSDIQPQFDVAARFGIIPKPVNATDLIAR